MKCNFKPHSDGYVDVWYKTTSHRDALTISFIVEFGKVNRTVMIITH